MAKVSTNSLLGSTLNDIHEDFAALIKKIQTEHGKTVQRDNAVGMVEQAQEWVRALEASRYEAKQSNH